MQDLFHPASRLPKLILSRIPRHSDDSAGNLSTTPRRQRLRRRRCCDSHYALSFVPRSVNKIHLLLIVFLYCTSTDWISIGRGGGGPILSVSAQQGQDPTLLNGGSILAMAGRDCVAVAVDRRFGSGSALVNVPSGRSLLLPSDRVLVAFTGLQSDVETLQHELLALVSSKYTTGVTIRTRTASSEEGPKSEGSPTMMISPRSMASLTSHVLYGRRRAPYYVEPIVVGLEECEESPADESPSSSLQQSSSLSGATETGETTSSIGSSGSRRQKTYRPYLCSMDVIGATSLSADFACGGAATSSLYGTAEAFWRPNMDRTELLEVIAKSFVAALERDCLSGYGVLVYMLTADGITEYDISTRND
jgi:20S proteasome subunit beta 3